MSFDARYSSYKWRKLRAWVRARDLGICKVDLPGCTKIATQVDHVREPGPPGRGNDHLFWDPANLRASCRHCNISKRNRHRAELARRAEFQRPSRDW
jgi:5-methylcytosine-specific restriction endonuclease McrA